MAASADQNEFANDLGPTCTRDITYVQYCDIPAQGLQPSPLVPGRLYLAPFVKFKPSSTTPPTIFWEFYLHLGEGLYEGDMCSGQAYSIRYGQYYFKRYHNLGGISYKANPLFASRPDYAAFLTYSGFPYEAKSDMTVLFARDSQLLHPIGYIPPKRIIEFHYIFKEYITAMALDTDPEDPTQASMTTGQCISAIDYVRDVLWPSKPRYPPACRDSPPFLYTLPIFPISFGTEAVVSNVAQTAWTIFRDEQINGTLKPMLVTNDQSDGLLFKETSRRPTRVTESEGWFYFP